MTDLSKLIDFSGSTLICNDVLFGTGTTGGLEAVTADTPSLTTLAITNSTGGRFTIKGVNLNAASTDNSVTISLPTGITTYMVRAVYLWGASGNTALNAATVGVFSAASAGGTAIVADGVMTPTSGTADTLANMQTLTLAAAAANTSFTTAKTLFVRTGTKTNATVTANFSIEVDYLG